MLGLLNYAKNNAITIEKKPNNMHVYLWANILFMDNSFRSRNLAQISP